MKRFEYKVLELPVTKGLLGGKVNIEELTHLLNDAGKNGWEVIKMGNGSKYDNSRNVIIILKREIN